MNPAEPRIQLPALEAMLVAALRPHLDREARAARAPSWAAPATDVRWRLKQMQRQEWPATLQEDPFLKRGYTPRQALRVLGAMCLADAGLGPTQSVTAARDNENAILSTMHAAAGVGAAAANDQARYGMIRPAVLSRAAEPNPALITPASADGVAGMLAGDESGRALLVLDFGGAACRAIAALVENGLEDVAAAMVAVLASGAGETLAGRGYVPVAAPVGDRYASPRRLTER